MTQINLTFKENFIKSFVVGNELTVGSSPSCEIFIDSLAVQPQHAQIIKRGDTFTITSTGGDAEVLINGEKISSQTLNDGDQIQIGKHTLEFIAQATPDPEMPAPDTARESIDSETAVVSPKKMEAFLQVLNGSNVGKTISLTRSLTNLGKSGIQTAVIARRENGYFLSHLEGENSPTVNNRAIGDSIFKLQSGDSIQIGNVKLLFSLS